MTRSSKIDQRSLLTTFILGAARAYLGTARATDARGADYRSLGLRRKSDRGSNSAMSLCCQAAGAATPCRISDVMVGSSLIAAAVVEAARVARPFDQGGNLAHRLGLLIIKPVSHLATDGTR